MNLTAIDNLLHGIVAQAQGNNFLGSPRRTLAPGVTVEGRVYNSPAGRGISAVCTLAAGDLQTTRLVHFGPESIADRPWQTSVARTICDALVDAGFIELPLEVQLAFANKFATVRELRRAGLDELAHAVVADLETPPALASAADLLRRAKATFLFYLAP